MSQKELDALRSEIDRIDETLISLLSQRFRVTAAVGQLKSRTGVDSSAPDREANLLDRVASLSQAAKVSPDLVRQIFRAIIDEVVREHERIKERSSGEP